MKLGESLFLRTDDASANRHLFCRFFQRFSKEKQFFSIVETHFSISFMRLMQTDFLLSRKCIFLVRLFCCQQKPLLELGVNSLKKELILASGQLIFQLVKTILFLHFSETAVSDSFFPSSGNVFFNEILHSSQWKRIFRLVETHFVCSEVFPSSGNRHCNY